MSELRRLDTVGQLAGIKLAEFAQRVNYCGRCDKAHNGTAWICSDCLDGYRRDVDVKRRQEAVASVPEAYRGCMFGLGGVLCPDLAARTVQAGSGAIRSVERSSAMMLTLHGPSGAGKTSLAVAKFLSLVDGPRSRVDMRGLFASAYDIGRARAIHPLGDGEAPLIAKALRVPLLLIDDLGAERQDMTGALGELVFDRLARGKRTIVTTGFDTAACIARYGSGIARRLFEGDSVKLGAA